MYISNSSEKHIFDSGIDVFFYLIVTGVFSIIVFFFDVGNLITTLNSESNDVTDRIAVTGSLSVYGFLFFASIAYDFWSRYNSATAKRKYILDALLFLWVFFFCVTIIFLVFSLMTCVAKELFIEKQAHILNIANYLNYAAIIPIIISVVEGIKFIREKHQEKIKQNENDVEPTPNQQERYRNSAV